MNLGTLKKRIVCFDIETTGFNIFHNNIIEIAALDNFGNKFETLINPNCIIPKKITDITKISQDMVANKPCISDALLEFVDFLNGTKLYSIPRSFRKVSYCIGHNCLAFDVPFIKAQSIKNNISLPDFKVLDTMRISQYLLPNNYSHSLANLAEFYDLKNDNAHRAMSDVLTTSKIFTELLSLFMSINHITSPQTDMFTEEDFNNPKIRLLSDIELLYNKTTIN